MKDKNREITLVMFSFLLGLVFGAVTMFNTGAKSGYLECIDDFNISQTYIKLKGGNNENIYRKY